MEIKYAYLMAFREADPKGFNSLTRSGRMDAHLTAMGLEAQKLLDQMLAQAPKDQYGKPTMQAVREAEEHVRAIMLDFPTPEKDLRPEMPWDLPRTDQTRRSAGKTTSSSQEP
jgi:hypothetical protein